MQTRYRCQLLISGTIFTSCLLLAALHFQTGPISHLYRKIKLTLEVAPLTPTGQTASSPEYPQDTTAPDDNGNFSALRALCAETQWTPGLWLHCHSLCGPDRTSMCGGLNNARNRISTCIRYAIDAGAGVVIPLVTTRSESELQETNGTALCPSVFWDMEQMKSQLENYCPQLNLTFCDDPTGISKVIKTPYRGYWQPAYHKGSFAEYISRVFTNHSIIRESMLADPVMISFADNFVGWSYTASNELFTIRKDLFRLLQHNQELLSTSLDILAHPRLRNGNFIGVHLRAEKDWTGLTGSREDQMRLYKQEIERLSQTGPSDIRTVYVSCGDKEAIDEFRRLLLPLGYTAHDKWTLLAYDEDLLARIDDMSFDQKAIVEYGILIRSKYFLGPAMSSMTSLIAYERTLGEEKDLFTAHIFPWSTQDETRGRTYPITPVLLGDEWTKLMVVDGFDMMDSFP